MFAQNRFYAYVNLYDGPNNHPISLSRIIANAFHLNPTKRSNAFIINDTKPLEILVKYYAQKRPEFAIYYADNITWGIPKSERKFYENNLKKLEKNGCENNTFFDFNDIIVRFNFNITNIII